MKQLKEFETTLVQTMGDKMSFQRSVQKVSRYVICKIETFTEEDIRYKNHYTKDNDASVPSNEAPWDLTQ